MRRRTPPARFSFKGRVAAIGLAVILLLLLRFALELAFGGP